MLTWHISSETYKVLLLFIKVELAHGGHRSSAVDHYSCYKKGGGGCGGVSRRSEYRGLHFFSNNTCMVFFPSVLYQRTSFVKLHHVSCTTLFVCHILLFIVRYIGGGAYITGN